MKSLRSQCFFLEGNSLAGFTRPWRRTGKSEGQPFFYRRTSWVPEFLRHVFLAGLAQKERPWHTCHTQTTFCPEEPPTVRNLGISCWCFCSGAVEYGSKFLPPPRKTSGFSPCVHLPGFHFGYLSLTHSHMSAFEGLEHHTDQSLTDSWGSTNFQHNDSNKGDPIQMMTVLKVKQWW